MVKEQIIIIINIDIFKIFINLSDIEMQFYGGYFVSIANI